MTRRVHARHYNAEQYLASLTLKEKSTLLAGDGWWHTESVDGKVPSAKMSDGPNGVRGERVWNGVPATCFPCSTGLGSSFDVTLAREVGEALAYECSQKGVHILLAPTVNTQRSPLGGRGFESFSEDPLLNGKIAANYINGLQGNGVAATIKHFVANDQEFERFSSSSEVSERALREIYLKPFQIAIKESNPWALMTSYNRINGLHASENSWLLQDVLRKEWGFKGTVMSDWGGTYSTAEAIKAGLDIEMPGPPIVRGPAIAKALQCEKLFPQDIDDRAIQVLNLVKHAVDSGIPFNKKEEAPDDDVTYALLRRASASSVVLLKNNEVNGNKLLPIPFSTDLKIAVIGPNAKQAMISGGGSASLRPTYTISPLQGVKNIVAELGGNPDTQVFCSPGIDTQKYTPLVDSLIRLPDDTDAGGKFEFWNTSPDDSYLNTDASLYEELPAVTWWTTASSSYAFLADGVDDCVNEQCWIRYTTTFTPDESGLWNFGLSVAGIGNLFIDNQLIVDLTTDAPQGDSFFGFGTIERTGTLEVVKGQQYAMEVRLSNKPFLDKGAPFTTRGGLRVGGTVVVDPDLGIEDAVVLAAEVDVAIVVVGLNADYESEGFDRENMQLPGETNKLVREILKVQSNTIVVNQSGTPVEMPWVDDTTALLQAFYGGNNVGEGLADVLFGRFNPSAKLPISFPKRLEDNPSYPSYGFRSQEHGKVLYNEGVFVGYRGYESKKVLPLFHFGYGLSYTTFSYSALELALDDSGELRFIFKIKNTGTLFGEEIAQVYIGDEQSSLPRPVKELKDFVKVGLEPGDEVVIDRTLDKSAFSFWDTKKGSWIAEAGVFDVIIAASSADIRLVGQVLLEQTITWDGL